MIFGPPPSAPKLGRLTTPLLPPLTETPGIARLARGSIARAAGAGIRRDSAACHGVRSVACRLPLPRRSLLRTSRCPAQRHGRYPIRRLIHLSQACLLPTETWLASLCQHCPAHRSWIRVGLETTMPVPLPLPPLLLGGAATEPASIGPPRPAPRFPRPRPEGEPPPETRRRRWHHCGSLRPIPPSS